MNAVTPEEINRLTKPTEGFLCPLSANVYGLDFLNFTISDYESKKVIFEIGRDNPAPQDVSVDFGGVGEDMYRKIKYTFSEDVLKLPTIQTTLVFGVGNREVQDFRMIERHYFRDQLVKSFDFPFGFCIPGSVNTWDAVYQLPPLSPQLLIDMIENPYETKSDSFYFVNGKLVMHNKATYKYIREDAAQSKKSYENKYGGSKGSKTATTANPAVAAAKPSSATAGAKLAKSTFPADPIGNLSDMKIADAKEAPSSSSTPRGGSSKAPSKEIPWSKESDYA